ncbi:YadA family autotransporter adhesin [Lysobacter antibioticus]|uniref:Putative inner membrane protein n=1 Tax=Lysobacter antibioticus TaxID=84531 RepID=A0A0S2FHX8_LYSAN|nr:YadA-like family protein [Lysobacter antibioticus]ALN83161.1 putative inner membrane protein [Lysobacter antibioticus]
MNDIHRASAEGATSPGRSESKAGPSQMPLRVLSVSLACVLLAGHLPEAAAQAAGSETCSTASGTSAAVAQGYGSTACGNNAKASYGSTTAFGFYANANATTATAIGADALVNSGGGTAIGNQARIEVNSLDSVALGVESNVSAASGTSLGGRSKVLAEAGTALGHASAVSGARATALGASSKANAEDSVAIGYNARANHAQSVALGTGSVTTAGAQTGYDAAYVGASNSTGQVNVGGRTVGSVAAGIAADDAVNVSQLRAGVDYAIDESKKYTDTRVEYAIDESKKYTDSRVSEVNNSVTNLINGSAGVFQVSQDDTAAASASGVNSTAGGADASASGARSTALGNGASATGANSVAIGAGSVASQANTVSIGSAGNERRLVNVAEGVAGTDGVNVNQLNRVGASSVQYDKNPDGTVNYNRISLNPAGGGTTIHNVRAGVAPTDAVNVKQLNDGMAKTLTQANHYTDQRIGDVRKDLHQSNRDARGGTAAAMAMAGLPQAYLPGRSMAAIAGSTYHGESGVAVGVSTISDNGRYVYKLQGSSNTTGDWGMTVGAGIQW